MTLLISRRCRQTRIYTAVAFILFVVLGVHCEGFMGVGHQPHRKPAAATSIYTLNGNQRRLALSAAIGTIPDDSIVAFTALSNLISMTAEPTGMDVSPEPIHTAFTVATFLPQPFWLLIILFPRARFTERIMGGIGKIVY